MVDKLPVKELVRVAAADAACNEQTMERVVQSPGGEEWPHEEVDFYVKNLYPCRKPMLGEGDDRYMIYSELYQNCLRDRLRNVHKTLVSDRICWKSEGFAANQDLARRIEELCGSDELDEAGKARCMKFASTVRDEAKPTLLNEFWVWLGGAAFLFYLFAGMAHDNYNWAKTDGYEWVKKKVKSFGRKGGGDDGDGTGGAGGSGGAGGEKKESVVSAGRGGPVFPAGHWNDEEKDSATRAIEQGGALVMLYGAAKLAAGGLLRAFAATTAAFMVVPGPVIEEMADPGRGLPPDA